NTMKIYFKVLQFLMLFAGLALGTTSCSDDPTPEVESKPTGVTITITSTTYAVVSFTLAADKTTLFAYKVAPKGTSMTAQQVFDEGTKCAPQAEAYSVTKLVQDTEYTLFAISMGQNGMSDVAKVDFRTIADSGAPATAKSIGIRFTEITQNSLKYSLQRGSEVTGGYLTIMPTITLTNYVDEQVKTGATRDDVMIDMLMNLGYGLAVDGTESEAEWKQQTLVPDASYTVMLLGMMDKTTPGDLATVDFRTLSFELKGNPTVTLTTDYVNYMSACFRYTLNKDAYGYMRFVADKSEIDGYLTNHSEDDLREFVRHTDFLFEQTYQKATDMEKDANGNPTVSESFSFGWDLSGHEYTALAVACDNQLSVSRTQKLARVDVTLTEKPVGDDVVYDCYASSVSATAARIHADFSPETRSVFYAVLPADSYEATIAGNGGDIIYGRILWEEGWGIGRTGSNPTDPIFHNDWPMKLAQNSTYVIVSTAVGYNGLINEKLLISKPFTTKTRVFGDSDATVKVSADRIGKYGARGIFQVPKDNVVWLYNVCLEGNDPGNSSSDDAMIQYLISGECNEWIWEGEGSSDWSPELQAETYGYTLMNPNSNYTIYACAEDEHGHITSLARSSFTTLPETVGPNPKITTMNVYDITSTSCKMDIIVNDNVNKIQYILVWEDLLDYDPATGTEEQLSKAVYDFVVSQGVTSQESIVGASAADITPKNGVFYLGAIAYGTEGHEDYKYMKVQLSDGHSTGKMLPAKTLSLFHKVIGKNLSKTIAGQRAANLKAFDRSPINKNGVIHVKNQAEANHVMGKLGGLKVSKMSDAPAGYRRNR
ncbi:MAG: hypothetical protein RR037_06950, partial [Alistipes sp.]